MSYLISNFRRVTRELRGVPPSEVPGKIASIARPKLFKLAEEAAYRTGLGPRVAKNYRGHGVALMFHEIHDDVDRELRTGCDVDQLSRIINSVQSEGRDIVTVSEGLRRLKDPESRPFALLTFDDAYRDNQRNALPVLEQHDVPMTLFVPTGMIDRSIYAWWLGLRQVIKTSQVLELPAMKRTFQAGDLASKTAAMRQITGWIGTDQARAETLREIFTVKKISIPSLVDHYAMDAAQLRAFGEHPLVTIGAHTKTHRFLSNLAEEAVQEEFSSNKAFLENLLQSPVDYLAYPYGTPDACGVREAELARDAGFKASFTTRAGQLFPDHLSQLQLLPRIDVGYAPQSQAALASRLSGVHRLLTSRLGQPVATVV